MTPFRIRPMLFPVLASGLALGLAASPAPAQTPDPNMWVTDAGVSAIATAGNTIYLGGSFAYVGPSTGHFVGVDAGTGVPEPGWPRVDGAVHCSVADGTGGWYIGGSFTSVSGVARTTLAHIRADMTLDAWNPGSNGIVSALAVSGATVYAGGEFSRIGGQNNQGFAALRPDASAPTVQVLSPNGNSPLLIGTQRYLTWSASDDLAVQTVDLHLSRTGPAGPWVLLAAAAPNTGSYLWNVTGPEVAGNDAYLLVAARDYGGHLGTDICNSGFSISSSVVDVGPGGPVIAFALSSPAPSPTTDHSVLSYAIPSRSHVRFVLLDVRGHEVAVIFDGLREAGHYTEAIEAAGLRSGMYFAHLRAGERALSRRVVVVK